MAAGQDCMEITVSPTFCWRSANKSSFNTTVWYNFRNDFSSQTACGPQFALS